MAHLHYQVIIENPEHHYVKVKISGEKAKGQKSLTCFLPSWSPGSYLMREYARNIRWIKGSIGNGERLFHHPENKNTWLFDWQKSELNTAQEKILNQFSIEYEVYCHELTVRTSHIDIGHAFLHGPSYLLGIEGMMENPTIEFNFPTLWSKLSTGLKEISQKREEFIFSAKNYDELIDCPVEIGCHETDGFLVDNIPHELAIWGQAFPHQNHFKNDIEVIVKHIQKMMGGKLPYEKYVFIVHFARQMFGGLEHANSTALHYDGRLLGERKSYLEWLNLVSHEYFHLWNVKRIRPKEFGPFDYRNEVNTSLLWLSEGMTSFVDQLFVYQAGLMSLEEYLDMIKGDLEKYFSCHGRKFHSLEESAFYAWIKLYRADENFKNSSISYYLKGGIVFFLLNLSLAMSADRTKNKKSFRDLLLKLWERYLKNPEVGIIDQDVYQMIAEIAGPEIKETFVEWVTTTKELDFHYYFKACGLNLCFEEKPALTLGASVSFEGDRVIVQTVDLDGPAFKSGVNAQDEILAINFQRVLRSDWEKISSLLALETSYDFLVSRQGRIFSLTVVPGRMPAKLLKIEITDREKIEKALLWL